MRRETFPASGPIRLDLHVDAGEIVVEAGVVAETIVELEPLGGEESERAVEEARVDFHDGVLVVDVPGQRGIRLFARSPEVRLTVHCPSGCDLEIRAASADLRAAGRFASADVEAASGDVEVEQVARDAKVRTASGDVSVGRADSSLTVQTASGDQRIDCVSEGQVSLRSASGDIWIGIRRGSAVWVDAASISGDTTSELDVGGAPPAEGGEGPLVELRAQSMSGDVHVARATTAPELER